MLRRPTPNAALAEMWARDISNGINPHPSRDLREQGDAAPAPPEVAPPLIRPVPLERADWRAEQMAAERRGDTP